MFTKHKAMTPAQEQLLQLQALLAIEEQADALRYQEDYLKSSLHERKQAGLTWYPVVVEESGFGLGDKLWISLSRSSSQPENHQMQVGKPVALFCNADNASKDRLQGTVQSLKGDTLKISFQAEDLPDWIDDGKLGIDLLFDESSYQEMRIALEKTIGAEKNRTAHLREVLHGSLEAQFGEIAPLALPTLNESQNAAVAKVLAAEEVAIIHGPPGTGKTSTLVEAIRLTLKQEKQVLVSAASNLAVDVLVERLAEKGIKVLRIGNPSRVSEHLLRHTLDYRLGTDKAFATIKKLRRDAYEYQQIGKKYKRNFGPEERQQRKLVLAEARRMSQDANHLEAQLTQGLIEEAQVIACTLVGAAHKLIRQRQYSTVFIDEAAQALTPACWIAIGRGHRVVLAGDHCQLPPTVKSVEAERKGLSNTLFEQLVARQPQVSTLLEIQYRMHEQIAGFSSGQFYEGRLRAHESVATALLPIEDTYWQQPITFIDTAGCGFEEKTGGEGQSLQNPEEAALLLRHLEQLYPLLPEGTQVGVVSPYKAQVQYFKEILGEKFRNLQIATLDGFQGQEKEVIYISLVRSNAEGVIGFLTDIRRMNVALTRAKHKLIVIGDSATLATHPFYQHFLDYVEQAGAYQSAWEWL